MMRTIGAKMLSGKLSDKAFEKHWGFTPKDVITGEAGYSFKNWFQDLEKALNKTLKEKAFKGYSKQEKAKFKCLSYMACSAYASEADPRELSEKTFPHFQAAILELSEEFKPFGAMLETLYKREFRKGLASGKNNVEAVKVRDETFRKAYEASFMPRAAKLAQVEISWD